MWEHESGFNPGCYTFKRRPLILRYSIHHTDIRQAMEWEKQIKGWSRKKKEALFNEDWEKIKRLAKNYTEYPRNTSGDTTDYEGGMTGFLPQGALTFQSGN